MTLKRLTIQQNTIERIIFEELARNIVKKESKKKLLKIIK
jgi:aspartate/glutamate racemase